MDQRVAIVTGGNRGIGREICRRLPQHGLRVLLTSRDRAAGLGVAEELSDALKQAIDFHPLDVASEESVSALQAMVAERYGRCDVLINNAAVALDRGASFFDTDPDTIRATFEINTLGAVRMCQALVPLMRKRGYGRIVNVSSGMGALDDMNGGWTGYRLSKAALNAVTRIVADEVAGTNIKCNAVCPGWVRTDMGGSGAPRSVEQAADGIVWLATLGDDGPTGGFFRDRQPIAW